MISGEKRKGKKTVERFNSAPDSYEPLSDMVAEEELQEAEIYAPDWSECPGREWGWMAGYWVRIRPEDGLILEKRKTRKKGLRSVIATVRDEVDDEKELSIAEGESEELPRSSLEEKPEGPEDSCAGQKSEDEENKSEDKSNNFDEAEGFQRLTRTQRRNRRKKEQKEKWESPEE